MSSFLSQFGFKLDTKNPLGSKKKKGGKKKRWDFSATSRSKALSTPKLPSNSIEGSEHQISAPTSGLKAPLEPVKFNKTRRELYSSRRTGFAILQSPGSSPNTSRYDEEDPWELDSFQSRKYRESFYNTGPRVEALCAPKRLSRPAHRPPPTPHNPSYPYSQEASVPEIFERLQTTGFARKTSRDSSEYEESPVDIVQLKEPAPKERQRKELSSTSNQITELDKSAVFPEQRPDIDALSWSGATALDPIDACFDELLDVASSPSQQNKKPDYNDVEIEALLGCAKAIYEAGQQSSSPDAPFNRTSVSGEMIRATIFRALRRSNEDEDFHLDLCDRILQMNTALESGSGIELEPACEITSSHETTPMTISEYRYGKQSQKVLRDKSSSLHQNIKDEITVDTPLEPWENPYHWIENIKVLFNGNPKPSDLDVRSLSPYVDIYTEARSTRAAATVHAQKRGNFRDPGHPLYSENVEVETSSHRVLKIETMVSGYDIDRTAVSPPTKTIPASGGKNGNILEPTSRDTNATEILHQEVQSSCVNAEDEPKPHMFAIIRRGLPRSHNQRPAAQTVGIFDETKGKIRNSDGMEVNLAENTTATPRGTTHVKVPRAKDLEEYHTPSTGDPNTFQRGNYEPSLPSIPQWETRERILENRLTLSVANSANPQAATAMILDRSSHGTRPRGSVFGRSSEPTSHSTSRPADTQSLRKAANAVDQNGEDQDDESSATLKAIHLLILLDTLSKDSEGKGKRDLPDSHSTIHKLEPIDSSENRGSDNSSSGTSRNSGLSHFRNNGSNNGSKKRSREDDGNGGEDDFRRSPPGPQSIPQEIVDLSKRFTCPFAKGQPDKFPKCCLISRQILSGVKEHLKRNHFKGELPEPVRRARNWEQLFLYCNRGWRGPVPSPYLAGMLSVANKNNFNFEPAANEAATGRGRYQSLAPLRPAPQPNLELSATGNPDFAVLQVDASQAENQELTIHQEMLNSLTDDRFTDIVKFLPQQCELSDAEKSQSYLATGVFGLKDCMMSELGLDINVPRSQLMTPEFVTGLKQLFSSGGDQQEQLKIDPITSSSPFPGPEFLDASKNPPLFEPGPRPNPIDFSKQKMSIESSDLSYGLSVLFPSPQSEIQIHRSTSSRSSNSTSPSSSSSSSILHTDNSALTPDTDLSETEHTESPPNLTNGSTPSSEISEAAPTKIYTIRIHYKKPSTHKKRAVFSFNSLDELKLGFSGWMKKAFPDTNFSWKNWELHSPPSEEEPEPEQILNIDELVDELDFRRASSRKNHADVAYHLVQK